MPDIDETEGEKPKEDGKPNLRFWRSQFAAAEKAGKDHCEYTKKAWDEFTAGNSIGTAKLAASKGYPIYWSSVRVMQPALYCRTPQTIMEKAFQELTDPVARLASTVGERLSKYLMRSCPFDRTMYLTRDNYIHGGKTTCRVIFDADISQKASRKNYTLTESPDSDEMQYLGEDGKPFEGTELEKDDQGYFTEDIEESIEGASCSVIPVDMRDLMHTPNARHWEEVDWIRFKSPMTKKEVVKRFGEEGAAKCKFKSLSEDKDKDVEGSIPTHYAIIGETWDKNTKSVYWDCEGYEDDFLETRPDPYSLIGFFPCPPFMLGTCGPDHLYPTPDYIQLKPFIDQLHGCAERFRRLVMSAKVVGLFDSNQEGLKALEQFGTDAIYLGIANMKDLIAKGGLENLVQHFPIDKITKAINDMAAIITAYEQKFYELYGIPDILRGISDPRETAEAQQQKGKFISGMFQAVQREFQRVVRDSIELMVDLALKKYPIQMLAEITGYQFMQPQEQQMFQQAIALLQNDRQRMIRISIETDSTHTMNENADIEQANYLGKTLMEGIGSMAPVLQNNPEFGPVMMETLLFIVRQTRQGKQVEESLLNAMKQALQPKQPGPDPVMQEAQIQAQAAQQKIQADMQIAQLGAQSETQLKMADLEFKKFELQTTTQIKSAEINLKMNQLIAETTNSQLKHELEKEKELFNQQIRTAETQIEEYRVVLDEKEKYLEEMRLQQQAETERNKALETEVKAAKSEKPPQVIVVHPKPSKKRATITRDAFGNATIESEDIPGDD